MRATPQQYETARKTREQATMARNPFMPQLDVSKGGKLYIESTPGRYEVGQEIEAGASFLRYLVAPGGYPAVRVRVTGLGNEYTTNRTVDAPATDGLSEDEIGRMRERRQRAYVEVA